MKISIIMPVYNAEKYLNESIQSALSQDLHEIEIICIDDGSTDSSFKLLKKLKEQDSRIIIQQQENQGSGIARNLGLRSANGEFVTFLDADDWYPSTDVLSTLFNKANSYNKKIAGGSFVRYYQDGRIESEFKGIYKAYKFEKEEIISVDKYQFDYGYHRFIYNRKMLIDNEIFFPDYRRFQDPPFFLNALIKAESFVAVDKQVYAYRKSHKVVEWDVAKVKGLLSGLLENLIISRKLHFPLLHLMIVNRVENDFWNVIMKFQDVPVIYYLCVRFLKSIDSELIKKEDSDFDFTKLKLYNKVGF